MSEDMGPRQKAAETKKRRTREMIVNAVLDLYGDQKEGDYTLEQIAQEAGVGTATISNHFPSKYDLLSTAYRRVIAPEVDLVVNGFHARTYKPADPVDELIRYVYRVATLSHEHHALTVAMTKAYMDLPAERVELRGNEYPSASYQLGEAVYQGMSIIMRLVLTAEGGGLFSNWGFIDDWTRTLLADSLIWIVYHAPDDGAPLLAARHVCVPLLLMLRPREDWSGLEDRIKRVASA